MLLVCNIFGATGREWTTMEEFDKISGCKSDSGRKSQYANIAIANFSFPILYILLP